MNPGYILAAYCLESRLSARLSIPPPMPQHSIILLLAVGFKCFWCVFGSVWKLSGLTVKILSPLPLAWNKNRTTTQRKLGIYWNNTKYDADPKRGLSKRKFSRRSLHFHEITDSNHIYHFLLWEELSRTRNKWPAEECLTEWLAIDKSGRSFLPVHKKTNWLQFSCHRKQDSKKLLLLANFDSARRTKWTVNVASVTS